MKQPFWMVILLFVIELGVVLLLVPRDWTQQAIIKEEGYVERTLGQQSRDWIQGRANNWYQKSMVDSGAYEAMYQHLIPSQQQKANSRGAQDLGVLFFKWWEGRLEALSLVIYQLFTRLALILLWLPYMTILFVPALFDGYMTLKIKRTNFAYASPVIHRYSVRGIRTLGIAMLIAFFLPIALDPIFIPVMLMAGCVFIGLAAGNLQKRI